MRKIIKESSHSKYHKIEYGDYVVTMLMYETYLIWEGAKFIKTAKSVEDAKKYIDEILKTNEGTSNE